MSRDQSPSHCMVNGILKVLSLVHTCNTAFRGIVILALRDDSVGPPQKKVRLAKQGTLFGGNMQPAAETASSLTLQSCTTTTPGWCDDVSSIDKYLGSQGRTTHIAHEQLGRNHVLTHIRAIPI